MNKLIIPLAIGVALAIPATGHATPPASPVLTASADCAAGLTVTTSGWPEGSEGIIGFGSNPPWGAAINSTGTYGGHTPAEPIAWNVLIRGPGQTQQELQGLIDCTPLPEVVELQPTTERQTDPIDPNGLWDHVALAPPW